MSIRERVTFTGGSFMICVARNAQMTLHGMVKHDAHRVDFVFPTDAIWVEDLDRGRQAVVSNTFSCLNRHSSRVVKTIRKNMRRSSSRFSIFSSTEFPAVGYPRNPPTAALSRIA